MLKSDAKLIVCTKPTYIAYIDAICTIRFIINFSTSSVNVLSAASNLLNNLLRTVAILQLLYFSLLKAKNPTNEQTKPTESFLELEIHLVFIAH